ncbi:hypothetical protein [Flavobacterium channae]|uniref:hypothetical protein n=1 Tax=Flavobacterium channae TaxID=2897181 RepID=UPI001E3F7648|nr:hypothetical protein [Flavobacterium channae]UGS23733.1 hypothetical protein LOS89_00315 [Flavobacterium channae]
MKKSVKLFALAFVSLAIFSCTTDEYDAALEESVKVTENIQNAQFKYGDNGEETEEDEGGVRTPIDSLNLNLNIVEGTPLVVIKKD